LLGAPTVASGKQMMLSQRMSHPRSFLLILLKYSKKDIMMQTEQFTEGKAHNNPMVGVPAKLST
jgi:hypothetical protein